MATLDNRPAPSSHRMAPSSRDKILDVAEALFAQRGYSGVGLREVATRAGLGKSSLFHHFRSKGQLYLAVLDRVLGRIEERFEPILAAPGDAFERLDRCVDVLIDSLAEYPTTARLLLRGLFEDDDFPEEDQQQLEVCENTIHRILQRIHALIREGVEAGAFREVSAPHTLQTLIGATVYHFASGEFGEGVMGRPLFSAEAVRRRKDEVKTLLHHGLSAEPARPNPPRQKARSKGERS